MYIPQFENKKIPFEEFLFEEILPFFLKKEYLENLYHIVLKKIDFLKNILDIVAYTHIQAISEKISDIEKMSHFQEGGLIEALNIQKSV